MKKSTAILTSALFFFIGVVVGFAFAPIKKGLYVGNNNGNKNGNNNGNDNNDCLAKNMSDSDDDEDDYSE